MKYDDAVTWMFQQLPVYQNIGGVAYKKDLSNILKFSDHLGNPHLDFRSVHVAGTNGKGSVSHMLASILHEGGYKVGLYTSPHLRDFRERIKINGREISKKGVVEFLEQNQTFINSLKPSFFEMTVAMAFQHFSDEGVDIAIIEVGLGGRLDSTNIITPEVSVITNIGLDHKDILGDTHQKIAAEKAGIIKKSIPVVIGESQDDIMDIFIKTAEAHNSKIYFADQLIETDLKSDLKGNYQAANIKTVLQTIHLVKNRGFTISDRNIEKGLKAVVRNTGLKGRWQILQNQPKIICDVGHNVEGLKHVIDQLSIEPKDRLHIVFGVVVDKDLGSIAPIMPKDAIYYFCKPNILRGLDAQILKSKFSEFGLHGEVFPSVNSALRAAKANANTSDVIFVGGSTFVVAEVV